MLLSFPCCTKHWHLSFFRHPQYFLFGNNYIFWGPFLPQLTLIKTLKSHKKQNRVFWPCWNMGKSNLTYWLFSPNTEGVGNLRPISVRLYFSISSFISFFCPGRPLEGFFSLSLKSNWSTVAMLKCKIFEAALEGVLTLISWSEFLQGSRMNLTVPPPPLAHTPPLGDKGIQVWPAKGRVWTKGRGMSQGGGLSNSFCSPKEIDWKSVQQYPSTVVPPHLDTAYQLVSSKERLFSCLSWTNYSFS